MWEEFSNFLTRVRSISMTAEQSHLALTTLVRLTSSNQTTNLPEKGG
jgi:hypothetical protein